MLAKTHSVMWGGSAVLEPISCFFSECLEPTVTPPTFADFGTVYAKSIWRVSKPQRNAVSVIF